MISLLAIVSSFARNLPGFARLDGRGRPSLRVLFRRLQAQRLHYHLQVFPCFAFLAWVAEQKCRVVGDCQLASVPVGIVATRAGGLEVIEAAAQLRHRRIHSEQRFRGGRAESHEHFGLDDRDLSHQEWGASFALLTLGRTVPGRTTLHDVCDIYLLARDPHRFDHVVEKLAGTAHEGFALLVFIGSGAFADEHEFGLRIAHAEYDLLASLLVERAARAVAQVFANDLERLYRIADALFRFGSQHFKNTLLNYHRCRDRRGLAWTHLFSRFLVEFRGNICNRHARQLAHWLPVEIINAHLVVVTDARGERGAKLRVEDAGHCGLRITTFTTESQRYGEKRFSFFIAP